jgi:predicted nucleic acid-binding protein
MIEAAVFDACVLYSAPLRDFLLRLGYAKLIRPLWSEEIHAEWMRSLLKKRPDLQRERLERTRREMDTKFPHSLVTGYEKLIPMLHLPDPNDRHVLAAAIHAKASLIVTLNLDDFPESALASYGIQAVSPDDFVCRLIDYDSVALLDAVAGHRTALNRPAKTVEQYLETLEQQRLFKTAVFLREHRQEI